ncbi:MAG: hypothetical protein OXM03_04800 [Chloroflexota bacterium]|nr:hypothetical protein [Chloroflexota bacterium]MDE2839928.1 hypothetical protein [Chloroflexota bacterium]MDE2929358.1 hypothetical protein [Chloroflexota bacterium]
MAKRAPIRTIHVGVGRRGWWPLEVLTADLRFQPVALVDVSPELLVAAQGRRAWTNQFPSRNLKKHWQPSPRTP